MLFAVMLAAAAPAADPTVSVKGALVCCVCILVLMVLGIWWLRRG